MQFRNSLLLGLFVGLLASVVFAGGFAAGSVVTRSQSPVSSSDKDLNEFLSAYRLVTERSYNQHLNRRQLLYAAIDGMLAATGDPHTIFLSPKESQAAGSELNGSQYGGIGAIVVKSSGALRIISPLPHRPAAAAGLRDGDVVVKVDGQPVSSMSGDAAISRIHGRAGTTVHLTIKRPHGRQLTVAVRRASIPPVTAYYRPLPHRIAYVQIFSFGASTADDVQQALREARVAGARDIVLDLRFNPGGYVDTAQKIVSFFLDRGVVAYEQHSDKSLEALNVIPGRRIVHVPVAVLVDGGTASAAEITAAALRDEDHAVLIGLRTYGKGSMQSVYSLPDGSSVRITDRVWLTPKKASIQTVGLAPSIVVPPGPSDTDSSDRQLQAAERYLIAHRRT